MPKEVKVGGLHKVPMWDFVQVVVVATRVLEIRFGSWSFGRCLAPRKCVFLRQGRRRGCLGASLFDAGCLAPRKCVFLRQGRRRGCLGSSRLDAGAVKVGGLHKVPMWDFVQVVVVATRVLEIRFGSWELRQGRWRGCLSASRFDVGSARFTM
ncbi:Disease resistance protein TIR-NBS-LRR class family, partial [Prunus dulcis]